MTLEGDKFVEATVNKPSLQIDTLKLVEPGNPERTCQVMKIKGDKKILENKKPVDAPLLLDEEVECIEKWIASLKKIKSEKNNAPLPESKKQPVN